MVIAEVLTNLTLPREPQLTTGNSADEGLALHIRSMLIIDERNEYHQLWGPYATRSRHQRRSRRAHVFQDRQTAPASGTAYLKSALHVGWADHIRRVLALQCSAPPGTSDGLWSPPPRRVGRHRRRRGGFADCTPLHHTDATTWRDMAPVERTGAAAGRTRPSSEFVAAWLNTMRGKQSR